ncbi:unnamed protein product [Coregonus sp. 'balchen']|nr:unnamed protein product [Coregonus sp. 'balchen']
MDNNENGKEEDTDQFFLDHVMNKLYDFGDGSVPKRKHKTQKKRSKDNEVEDEEDTAADDCSQTTVWMSDIRILIDPPDFSEVGNTSSATKQALQVEVVTFQDPTKRPRQARKPPVPEVNGMPPKKEHVNCKVLQQRVRDKKQKTKEEIQMDLKKKKRNKPRDEKRESSSSKAPKGQMGCFKNGMLVLSTKEIQKIKASIKKLS